MNKYLKNKFIILIFFAFLFSFFLIHNMSILSKASETNHFEIEGTNLNGATLLDESNKFINVKSYIPKHDNGYDISESESRYAFKKNEIETPYANFYIDTLGQGGSVYKGSSQIGGIDTYGFVAGSGEDVVYHDDDTDKDIIIGKKSIAIKLRYNFNSTENLLGSDGNIWMISDDTWKSSINGIEGVGVVGKGAVIVQKFVSNDTKEIPTTKDDWYRLNGYSYEETAGVHTVNFFDEFDPATNNDINVYVPSGEDLVKGIFVKIMVAYELVRSYSYTGAFGAKKTSKEYKNIIEETTFYLCNTSAEVVFTNLYFGDGTESDSSNTSIEQKTGTISNNQGSINGFRADINGWNYDVTYTVNNSTNQLKCTDGQVFLEPGKYDFYIKTKINVIRHKVVYIHENTKEENIKVYFGESIFNSDSLRVFLPNEQYPVFKSGTLLINTTNENSSIIKHAPLVGKLYYFDEDWANVKRDSKGNPIASVVSIKESNNHNWSFSNFKSGNYEAVFVNNEGYFDGTDTGDAYKFVYRFSVIDDGQAPVINDELISHQIGVSDFYSEVYLAQIPSSGKGNILVVFLDEKSAYDFESEYLASTVKVSDNGYYFNNVHYNSEKEMLEYLHKLSSSLVRKHYFDASDIMSFLTIKDSSLLIKNEFTDNSNFGSLLQNYDLKNDIYVFATEEDLENIVVGYPFLNDKVNAYIDQNGNAIVEKNPVYFIQVADYETSSVELYLDGTNLSYKVPYGFGVEEFLVDNMAPSGKYKIVEKNSFGTNVYYANYIRKGDMTSSIEIERLYNSNYLKQKLDISNDGLRLRANYFKITNIINYLDPYGIIKIESDNTKLIFQISDFDKIPEINEEGNYKITLVDRLGNTISFFIDIYLSKSVYTFSLKNNNEIILNEIAYAGKTFNLENLQSNDQKYEFAGWKDEEGNIYLNSYTFDKPKNVILNAVWQYSKVNIDVYDGKKIANYSTKVGDVIELPKLSKDGYELYGYRYILDDYTYRFYKVMLNNIPNVENIRLDAVWKKVESTDLSLSSNSSNMITLILVDGEIVDKIELEEDQRASLPIPEASNEMRFLGWLYENRLKGFVFNDVFNLEDIKNMDLINSESIKLVSLYVVDYEEEQDDTIINGDIFDSTIDNYSSGISINSKTKIKFWSALCSTLFLFIAMIIIVFSKNIVFLVKSFYKKQRKVFKSFVSKTKKLDNYKYFLLRVYAIFVCACFLLPLAFKNGNNESNNSLDNMYDSVAEIEYSKDDIYKQGAKLLNDSQETNFVTASDVEFLYSNLSIDLISMGFEDVFLAYATVGNKCVYGLGYTSYLDAYGDESNYIFGAGFISLADKTYITSDDVIEGVTVHISQIESDYYEYDTFRLVYNKQWGPNHYVAYNKYVTYQVSDYIIQASIECDNGNYNDTLGNVYSYDTGDYCHYTNYGEIFDFELCDLNYDVDYDSVLQIYKQVLDDQIKSSINIEIEQADFISIQALNDYVSHEQNEKFLGIDADTLLYYEANIENTQYYIIFDDGTVDILNLPPDPERQASIWERIWVGASSVVGAVVGVVACMIPGAGPVIGGALISASIDVFMQVSINGTPADKIDWISVATSAVIGALTGGIGAGASAVVGSLGKTVGSFFIKLGVQATAGLFSGAVTYLVGASIRGEELDYNECLKSMAIGAATGAIIFAGSQALTSIACRVNLNTLGNNLSSALKTIGQVLGGSLAGMTSYILACTVTGQEFTVEGMLISAAMGAATSTIIIIGNKVIKTVISIRQNRLNKIDEKRLYDRINRHLPSDKNENWSYETIDENGNFIKSSKKELIENPSQKMYLVNKDGARIEIIDGYPQFQDLEPKIKAIIDDGIVIDRKKNFAKFDKNLAKTWNDDNWESMPMEFKNYFKSIGKSNKDILNEYDILNARSRKNGLGYTWHEAEDMHTGYLVKTKIHNSIAHSGGIEKLQYELSLKKCQKNLEKQKMFNMIKKLSEENKDNEQRRKF